MSGEGGGARGESAGIQKNRWENRDARHRRERNRESRSKKREATGLRTAMSDRGEGEMSAGVRGKAG